MDFPKIAIERIREQQSTPLAREESIAVPIALLDRTSSVAMLYRLDPHVLQTSFSSTWKDAEWVGKDIIGVDKAKKEILLGNGTTVHYQYLITLTSKSPSHFASHTFSREEELAKALTALRDALRLHPVFDASMWQVSLSDIHFQATASSQGNTNAIRPSTEVLDQTLREPNSLFEVHV